MENRNTTIVYYKIYYTHNNKQNFMVANEWLMVKPILNNLQDRGYKIDYITEVKTRQIVSEKTLEVIY